jgi:hypothetical protein
MLNCLNCKAPVDEGKAKFFGKIFVCETCYTTAESFYDRLERDLKHLLLFAHESIRVALIEGKFHLSENRLKEVSRKDLLEEILKMEQRREQRGKTEECSSDQSAQETSSGVSTPPHVRTLVALGESVSNKQHPQD